MKSLDDDYDVETVRGVYKQSALAAAFERVKNKSNWKMPINRIVRVSDDELTLIQLAVTHFTGSSAEAQHLGGGRYRIRAAGYYAAIGA